MSERLKNLVEERRAIGRLQALLRATEQVKAAQKNQQQLWYYCAKRKVHRNTTR